MLGINQRFVWAVTVLSLVPEFGAKPMQSRELSAGCGCQRRYLEPVLQLLTGKEFLRGVRGPSGGYTLGSDPGVITLADVESILRERFERSAIFRKAPPMPILDVLFDGWRADLATITVAHLRMPAP